jgi:hypothetical protein
MNKTLAIIIVLISVAAIMYFTRGGALAPTLPSGADATSGENAPPGSIHNLPVPEAVAKARAHGASATGVPEGEVIVLTAYEKEWPNGCLGLEEKDEFCTQVITPGWEVTIQAKGKVYIYRTNSDGSVIREQ